MSKDGSDKLGFQSTWSMAVGGMVGGGIFSTLGVVIAIAGGFAWLSFLLAGIFAFLAGYSYVQLATKYEKSGGIYLYLSEIGASNIAGSLTWILIIGYILTMSVYAHTFGQYLGHLADSNVLLSSLSAVAIIGIFVWINLLGVGEAGGVEILLVWFKLIVLVGLAVYGIYKWHPSALTEQQTDNNVLWGAMLGAASIFMAYEGFQLLAYDYEDIRNPAKNFPRAVLSAIIVVTVVYMLVAVGVPMLIGTQAVKEHEEVALSIAGDKVAGTAGLIIVTIAAAASTGSAINATLFATARLVHTITQDGQLPAVLDHQNDAEIPDYAVLLLGAVAAMLAVIGSLSLLVEAASLAFLFTFAAVNALAFHQQVGFRTLTGIGSVVGVLAIILLLIRLLEHDPLTLAIMAALVCISAFVRPLILRNIKTLNHTTHDDDSSV